MDSSATEDSGKGAWRRRLEAAPTDEKFLAHALDALDFGEKYDGQAAKALGKRAKRLREIEALAEVRGFVGTLDEIRERAFRYDGWDELRLAWEEVEPFDSHDPRCEEIWVDATMLFEERVATAIANGWTDASERKQLARATERAQHSRDFRYRMLQMEADTERFAASQQKWERDATAAGAGMIARGGCLLPTMAYAIALAVVLAVAS